jgi:threonine aldolase
MRTAMAEAIVGDDVLGDDPTVQQLEHTVAQVLA